MTYTACDSYGNAIIAATTRNTVRFSLITEKQSKCAKPLIGLLEQSGQYIPDALRQLQFCAPSGGRGRGGGKRSSSGGYGGPNKRGRTDGTHLHQQ